MDKTINTLSCSGKNCRLKSFDLLRLYAIFLVLWGHTIQYFLSSVYYEEPVYRFIYSFHMPLFMMISGFFSISSFSLNIVQFVKKKSLQLLLPSFSWGVILWIWHTCYSFCQNGVLCFDFCHLMQIILFEFWFLKSCFLCYLLAFCGINYIRGQYAWGLLTLLISQFIPFFQMWIMYPCFVLGFILKKNAVFLSHIRKYNMLYAFLFIIMHCFWNRSFWIYDYSLYDVITGLVNSNFSPLYLWGYRIYRLGIGVVGCFFFIGLFLKIQNNFNNIFVNWGCVIGRYTLEIYVLQLIIIESILSCYLNFDNQNFYFYNFIIAPLISFSFLVLSIGVIKIIRKSFILGFLLFGKAIRY